MASQPPPPRPGRPTRSETETPRLPQAPYDGAPSRGPAGGGPSSTRTATPPTAPPGPASEPPASTVFLEPYSRSSLPPRCCLAPTPGPGPLGPGRGGGPPQKKTETHPRGHACLGGRADGRAPPQRAARQVRPGPARPAPAGAAPCPPLERGGYLVDPASSICLSQRLSHASLSTHGRYSETANGSLNQLWFL